jgi:hypothetical protein
VNTVKTHLKAIYGKLGVHTRREATAEARRLRLLLIRAQITKRYSILARGRSHG